MLEFDGATKSFGSLRALDACSFVARPGRLTGFLGPRSSTWMIGSTRDPHMTFTKRSDVRCDMSGAGFYRSVAPPNGETVQGVLRRFGEWVSGLGPTRRASSQRRWKFGAVLEAHGELADGTRKFPVDSRARFQLSGPIEDV
jgi:hypothetical protein